MVSLKRWQKNAADAFRKICRQWLTALWQSGKCIYPFMFGIYPYTAVTEKQRVAMKETGINYVYQTVYELTYSCLIRLLGV